MKITIDTTWFEGIKDMDVSVRASMYEAVMDYMSDKDPYLPNEIAPIFYAMQPIFDAEKFKRMRLAERSRENGKMGGRKTPKKNPTEPKKPSGFEAYLQDEKFQGRCENLLRLDEWMKKYTPYLYGHIAPLTNKEFECLLKKYNAEQICDTLLQIENRKDLRKNYTSLYRTLLNWMKTNYGTGKNNE